MQIIPRQNRRTSENFLSVVNPEAAPIVVETFRGHRRTARLTVKDNSITDEQWHRICEQNDLGDDIFFCPQQMRGKRSNDNFVSAPVLFRDVDNPGNADLLPKFFNGGRVTTVLTSKVETGYRQHDYILLDRDITDPQEFRELQTTLNHKYGGDKAIVNPSRLMRLPGTINHKHGAFPVSVVHADVEPIYTDVETIIEKLGHAPQEEELPDYDGDDVDIQEIEKGLLWTRTEEGQAALEEHFNSLDSRDPTDPNWFYQDVLMALHQHGQDHKCAKTMERLALKWAKQGNNFNGLSEFRSRWRSLGKRTGELIHLGSLMFHLNALGWFPDVFDEPEPEPEPVESKPVFLEDINWPQPILDIIEEYRDSCIHYVESYAVASALTIIAALSGIRYSVKGEWPRLYMNIVGRTSTGKGHVLATVYKIVGDIDPSIYTGTMVSRAALESRMRDYNTTLIVNDEVQGLETDYTKGVDSILSSAFTSSTDAPLLSRALKDSESTAIFNSVAHCLNLTTPEGMADLIDEKRAHYGYLSRMMFILPDKDRSPGILANKRIVKTPERVKKLGHALIQGIETVDTTFYQDVTQDIKYTAEAEKRLQLVYDYWTERGDSLEGKGKKAEALVRRITLLIGRIALLIAIADQPIVGGEMPRNFNITINHLAIAEQFMHWYFPQAGGFVEIRLRGKTKTPDEHYTLFLTKLQEVAQDLPKHIELTAKRSDVREYLEQHPNRVHMRTFRTNQLSRNLRSASIYNPCLQRAMEEGVLHLDKDTDKKTHIYILNPDFWRV